MSGKIREDHAEFVLSKVISCMKERAYGEIRITFMDGVIQDLFVTEHSRPNEFDKKPLTNKGP